MNPGRRTPVEIRGDHEWERIIALLNRVLAETRTERDRYRATLKVIAEKGNGADAHIAKKVLEL